MARTAAMVLVLVGGCLDQCQLRTRPIPEPIAFPTDPPDTDATDATDADTNADADAVTDPTDAGEVLMPGRVHLEICPLLEWFEYVGTPPSSATLEITYVDEAGDTQTLATEVAWTGRVGDGYQHQQAFDCVSLNNRPGPVDADDLAPFTLTAATLTYEDSRGEVTSGPDFSGGLYTPAVPPAAAGEYRVDVAFGLYATVVDGIDPATLQVAPQAPK